MPADLPATPGHRPGGNGSLNRPGSSCLAGRGLTPWSSSKASWQHSQYPFFLRGTVRAADRGLGSWSLGSLRGYKVEERSHCWGPGQGRDGQSWAGTGGCACTRPCSSKCGRRGKKEDKSSAGAPCASSVLSPPTHVKGQVRVGRGGSKNPLKGSSSSVLTPKPTVV